MARLLPGAAGLLKLFYFGSFFIVALDGSGAHSPYVVGLLEHLADSRTDVRIMLGSVFGSVYDATNGEQIPWYSVQLPGKLFFLKPE